MVERSRQLPDELRYHLLKHLQNDPHLSQRQLAARAGISLGKVNYCLKALMHKGLVKARNFRNSQNKLAYTYYLTPGGIEEKASLALSFLRTKIREVEALRQDLEDFQRGSADSRDEEDAPSTAER